MSNQNITRTVDKVKSILYDPNMTITEVGFIPIKDGKPFRKYVITTRKAINPFIHKVTSFYFDDRSDADKYLEYVQHKDFYDDVERKLGYLSSSMAARKEYALFVEQKDIKEYRALMETYSKIPHLEVERLVQWNS